MLGAKAEGELPPLPLQRPPLPLLEQSKLPPLQTKPNSNQSPALLGILAPLQVVPHMLPSFNAGHPGDTEGPRLRLRGLPEDCRARRTA